MIVEVEITAPTQEIVVRPVKYLDEYVVPTDADQGLLDAGYVNVTIMSGRDDHHPEVVVGTVKNLRMVNSAIVGDLTINGELRNYLDGNVLRFEIGAVYAQAGRSHYPTARPGFVMLVTRFTALHLVTPHYERVVAPKVRVEIPPSDATMHIFRLEAELAALSVQGIAISDAYYEDQVITKLRFSNGTEINVPRAINTQLYYGWQWK